MSQLYMTELCITYKIYKVLKSLTPSYTSVKEIKLKQSSLGVTGKGSEVNPSI